jgi:hypothetical protein
MRTLTLLTFFYFKLSVRPGTDRMMEKTVNMENGLMESGICQWFVIYPDNYRVNNNDM